MFSFPKANPMKFSLNMQNILTTGHRANFLEFESIQMSWCQQGFGEASPLLSWSWSVNSCDLSGGHSGINTFNFPSF